MTWSEKRHCSTRSGVVACLAAACPLVLSVAVASGSSAATREPARVQVTAREFFYSLSRPTVRSGAVVVELVNLGEDDHDLALRRLAKGSTTRRIRTTSPGRLGVLETRLRAGRYALWCSLADHRTRGMRATLLVRQAR